MKLLADVCCVCLPLSALPRLAGLRSCDKLRCWVRQDRLWLRWPAGEEEITAFLLPIPGIELFEQREGLWFRPGQRLPVFTVPSDDAASALARLLVPAPIEPVPPGAADLAALPFGLVRDEQPRPASALLCSLADLARWAELATSRQFAPLSAASCGERVLVRGLPLPVLAEGTRLWGERILTPLGFRPEPALPEAMLVQALGLNPGETAFVHPEGVEVVPATAWGALTRAGLRSSR